MDCSTAQWLHSGWWLVGMKLIGVCETVLKWASCSPCLRGDGSDQSAFFSTRLFPFYSAAVSLP